MRVIARPAKRHLGVTLIEVMLVMAVASTILILSMTTYQSMRSDNDYRMLQYNVAQLFQAMANYYKANCQGGVLDPNNTTLYPPPLSLSAPFPVTVANLQAQGYLDTWQPLNALIDPTDSYILQFNPSVSSTPPMNVNTCIVEIPGTKCTSTATSLPPTQAQTILWTSQVAVKLKDPTKAKVYKNMLMADCISKLSSSIVTTCDSPNTNGDYLVWARLPSNSSPETNSNLGTSMPLVKQFNLQYTHDQMYELMPGSQDNTGKTMRNYLCGG